MQSVLIASTNESACDTIQATLRSEYEVVVVSTMVECMQRLRKKRPEIVFVDVAMVRQSMQDNSYTTALQPLWNLYPTMPIIVMSSQEMIRETVMAVKAGADNYLTYPIHPEEVKYVITSLHEAIIAESELDHLRDTFWESEVLDVVHTRNRPMREVFNKVRSVAPTKSTVLLIGDTGTGKGVIAKLIHQHSSRRGGPFISVHCGAIPDTLVESELFGHEKGAFTGAVRRKLGKFEIARGGTIFLDEIGTITPSAQIKLLQILQDGTFSRVGGEEILEADVRVIVATNMDLTQMSNDGRFRKDLYYRLNVFPLEIPPLRERLEDIPFLVQGILAKLNRFHGKDIAGIHPSAMEAFQGYAWPGNIRELENLMERAYILETSSMLTPENFPHELFIFESSQSQTVVNGSTGLTEIRRRAIEQAERHYLKDLLAAKKGRIKDAAQAAGITSRYVHKLMKKYGIKKEDFR